MPTTVTVSARVDDFVRRILADSADDLGRTLGTQVRIALEAVALAVMLRAVTQAGLGPVLGTVLDPDQIESVRRQIEADCRAKFGELLGLDLPIAAVLPRFNGDANLN